MQGTFRMENFSVTLIPTPLPPPPVCSDIDWKQLLRKLQTVTSWCLPTCPELSLLPFWLLNMQPNEEIWGTQKLAVHYFVMLWLLLTKFKRCFQIPPAPPSPKQHKFILSKSRNRIISSSVIWELGLSVTRSSTVYPVLKTMRIFLLKNMFKTDLLMTISNREQVVLLIPILLFLDGRLTFWVWWVLFFTLNLLTSLGENVYPWSSWKTSSLEQHWLLVWLLVNHCFIILTIGSYLV